MLAIVFAQASNNRREFVKMASLDRRVLADRTIECSRLPFKRDLPPFNAGLNRWESTR
jgi:hypothetical protein